MSGVLTGTTLVASFLAGVVALFAPCCISVMLPAYFATSFGRRLRLVAMTFVFGAGLSLVILPVALGAAGLGGLVLRHHFSVFLVGGVLMLAMGVVTLSGRRIPLPMPGMRARAGRGPGTVFALGAFSGVASACCAPVLAGVAALSGASGSFAAALAIGLAYVFGMVFPLFMIALLWDRRRWGDSRLFRGWRVRIPRSGTPPRTIAAGSALSGSIMLLIGVLTLISAFDGNRMTASGWQTTLSARLQHWAHVATDWAGRLPGGITSLILLAMLAALAWIGLRQASTHAPDQEADRPDDEADESTGAPPAAPYADPLGDVTQKARDEALTTPVLADTDLAVSRAYNSNQYGMMGSSRDGHSFVLVDRAGVIRWRADYGGPPNFTMFVAPADVLGQLERAVGTAG